MHHFLWFLTFTFDAPPPQCPLISLPLFISIDIFFLQMVMKRRIASFKWILSHSLPWIERRRLLFNSLTRNLLYLFINILDDFSIVLLFFPQFFYRYSPIFLYLHLVEPFFVNLLHVLIRVLSLLRRGKPLVDTNYSHLFHLTLFTGLFVLTETILDLEFIGQLPILFLPLLLDTIVLDQHVHFGLQYMPYHSIEYYNPYYLYVRRNRKGKRRKGRWERRGEGSKVLWGSDLWVV